MIKAQQENLQKWKKWQEICNKKTAPKNDKKGITKNATTKGKNRGEQNQKATTRKNNATRKVRKKHKKMEMFQERK